MKKLLLLNLIFLLLSWSLNAQTPLPAGSGTVEDPYQIATLDDLYWLSTNSSVWNKNFIQTADIDASATADWPDGGWKPIGKLDLSTFTEYPFSGTYDGKNHTIRGLTINKPTETDDFYNGMFGLASGATIQNLGLLDLNIIAYYNAGGLGGRLAGCTVINCSTAGSVTTTITNAGSNTGGFAGGTNNYSSLSNCSSTCDVSGTGNIGGMVGYCERSTVTYCHSSGNVSQSSNTINAKIGGFAGRSEGSLLSKSFSTGNVTVTGGTLSGIYNGGFVGMANCFSAYPFQSTEITDCYCSGNVTGGSYACGFVGYNYINLPPYGTSIINNCYSRGIISGDGTLLPFAETNIDAGTINNCFYDADVDGLEYTESGTIWYGATGKTTAEMKTQSTYTGWDFTETWGISESINNGYPYLQSEPAPCLGYVYEVASQTNVTNSGNVLGLPDGEVANLIGKSALILDLTGVGEPDLAPGSTVTVTWRKNGEANPEVDIDISNNSNDVDASFYSYCFDNFVVDNEELEEFTIPINFDTHYIYIYVENDATLDIDAVTYNCYCTAPTPSVNIEKFCGYSVLTASNYTGGLTWVKRTPDENWITVEATESITVTEGGIYSVSQKDGDCLSLSGWADVEIINEPEQPGEISGLATPCEGGEEVYSIDPVNGATKYEWFVPENWTITDGQGTTTITVQIGKTYDITEDEVLVIVSNNYCTGVKRSSLAVQSIAAPDQPAAIYGPENPCEATQVIYSVSPVAGALHYIWAVPEGWQILDGNSTTQITVLVGANIENPQVISVYAGNVCARSEATDLAVESMVCCTPGEADVYEDNNTMEQAALITVGNPEIYANILDSKDVDWFYFLTSEAGSYTINYVPGSSSETMVLYNSSGRKLKPEERNGTTYSLTANTNYYIKVSARLKSPAPCYSLGVELSTASLMASEQYDDLKSAEIETVPEDGVFRVWPNPATEKFSFLNGMSYPVQVRVTDLSGRTVEVIQNVEVNQTVTFGENYVTGLYFVEANGDGKHQIFKVVKH